MQKIVITEKGLEKKKEMKEDPSDDNRIPSVKFDEEFLNNQRAKFNIESKRRQNSLSQKSIFSAKPYFLECREALEKTQILNEGQSFNTETITKQQYPGVFPPTNQFTTFSKRFPYDQPMRATTSSQEFRKHILQTNDIQQIKDIFLPPSSSQSKHRSNQQLYFPITIKQKEINNGKDLYQPTALEEKKEIKTILQQMGVNQQNVKQKFLSQSQFYFKPDAMPSSSSANQNYFQSPLSSKQNKQFSPFTPNNMIKQMENDQASPSHYKNDQLLDNPNERGQSAAKSNSNRYISPQSNFTPSKKGFVKFHSATNLSQIQASMIMNDSLLKNKIHKWQLKKLACEQQNKKIKQTIEQKVNNILEEKGNKPVHIATNFKLDLKNAESEIDELYEKTEKERIRYQERLKLFHIKKYKTFLSEIKLHTAQLSDKHHQIAHLGQKLEQDVEENLDSFVSKLHSQNIKNK